ncbi:C-_U-editing enzyme APOBEC-2 [Amblyraja radiata]|uniref:C->U-editing enzyme APOBEC-2 n=1 Tax=Amblyraja radiata TaxID=386614 RepID=UPI001402D1B5|nr:C->U-editing enzyme APOBEC-2 [Amblyraja radiata]
MAEKEAEEATSQINNEETAEGQENVEETDLGPFVIILGQQMPSSFFKFQFKNVEYSSGRNKTFLCYSVEEEGAECRKTEGYVEDEHTTMHAEEAFFTDVFKECDGKLKYSIIWYVSSSPCAACASKIVEYLKQSPNICLTIFIARLFMWEEPEIQQGLKLLKAAGCRLRIMKAPEYNYCWNTYVENEGESFAPWEDLPTSSSAYEGILNDILQHA